jgi:hypothetical protein
MKKITVLFVLFFVGITFAQNQSTGQITTPIFFPLALNGETFRFGPGLVTQLDSGPTFDFSTSRWFSLGRFNAGNQNVYGLRFQLENRAVLMGYQNLGDINPRIQWIGDSSASDTDLEFRVSNSFTSTMSNLVATMTNDGRTFFGEPLISNTKVGIDYSDLEGSPTGLIIVNPSSPTGVSTGIKISNTSSNSKNGIMIRGVGGGEMNTGIRVKVMESDDNIGIVSEAVNSGSVMTVGVMGTLDFNGIPLGFGAGIYGISANNPNQFAGYFDGDVFTTGLYLQPSDEKLKENVKVEKNALEKLAQLNAVTYTFKENENLNLPKELQHGFLAQNLEAVFPELVTTINKPIFDKEDATKRVGSYEYKAVNYNGLISVLAASLKELDEKSKANMQQLQEESATKIEQLKEAAAANVEALNDKIEALESRLAALTGEEVSTNQTTQFGTPTNGNLGFSMEQNKPNPFTNQTVINYTLPRNTKATISVVDLSGKFIKDYNLTSQKGKLTINSSEIGKGIFVYALISDNEVIMSKKMIVR